LNLWLQLYETSIDVVALLSFIYLQITDLDLVARDNLPPPEGIHLGGDVNKRKCNRIASRGALK